MFTQIQQQLANTKVIPVIVIHHAQDILPLAEILLENQIKVAEITLRSPESMESIKLLNQAYPEMLIGAGTVLTTEQVKQAQDVGANFIVSPGFNPETVEYCLNNKIMCTPGVNNPTAIEAALHYQLTFLKFFPAEASGGISMLKALSSPYSMVKFMPTGGITLKNLKDYLALSNVVACGGSWFVDGKLVAEHQWEKIKQLVNELNLYLKESTN